uniref:Uncharacterized protein n=1 Tax=Ciona savignyi TaxID=51511 RepID=H2ZHI3_CIOSA
MPVTGKNGRKYSAVFDENSTHIQVYSPVPEKYTGTSKKTKTFGMALRPRMPLKQLNSVTSLARVYLNSKHKRLESESDSKLAGCQDSKLKRKVQNTFNIMAEKITGKTKRQRLENSTTVTTNTPRTKYRERLNISPLSPDNPFDSPLPSSLSLSLRSRESTSASKHKTCTRRKRSYRADDFNNHLEKVSCGIEQLRTNADNFTAASKTPASIAKNDAKRRSINTTR